MRQNSHQRKKVVVGTRRPPLKAPMVMSALPDVRDTVLQKWPKKMYFIITFHIYTLTTRVGSLEVLNNK